MEQLRAKGYTFTLNQKESFLAQPKSQGTVNVSRERNRDTLKLVCFLKPRDTQSVTSLMLTRELENVRRELRNLKTGQHENKREKTWKVKRQQTKESLTKELDTSRMIRDPKRVSKCDKCQRIHERQLQKLHTLITQWSKTINKVEVKILVGAGPHGENVCESRSSKGSKNSKILSNS